MKNSLFKAIIAFAAIFPFLTFNALAVSGKDSTAEPLRVIKLQPGPALHQNQNLVNQVQRSTQSSLSAKPVYDGFKAYRVSANNRVVRYQQYHKGVKIFGHQVIGHFDESGVLKRLNGSYLEGIDKADVQTSPAFDELRASAIGKGTLLKGDWTFRNENIELVLYHDDKSVHLAYYLNFFADSEANGPTRPYFIIDAISGTIIKQWEGLTHADVGTGPGGNEKVGRYEYGTDFGFLNVTEDGTDCIMENTDVKTVDLNHGTSGTDPFVYDCFRNTHKEINGAYSPLNDAHYFGNQVFDMYNTWYGIPPLTFQLLMRVHYSTNYENAFWDGSSMTFGDGASTFYPLVSLDVVSHEVSHGFTEQHSDLIYSGQSGGINESFSDMAGEAAEYFMTGTNDFLVGASIFKAEGALRYMHDPPLDGQSIGHVDDYYDGMDVHYSSGIFNKTFYTLATSPDWNVKKAFDVFVVANQNYWTPATDFMDGACGAVSAAQDLGYDVADVNNAFTVVGLVCIPLEIVDLDVALDAPRFQWVTSGDAEWYGQNRVFFYNDYAAQSGDIGNSKQSVLQTTVTGPANLHFAWKVSSESDYDYLRILINGAELKKISGDHDWAEEIIRIPPGENVVTWKYTKDFSVSEGDDAGWVDKVELICDPGEDCRFHAVAQGIVPEDHWGPYRVTEGSTFTVTMTGEGDPDLYVRFGEKAGTRNYDCRSRTWSSAEESCELTVPAGETEAYIMVKGRYTWSWEQTNNFIHLPKGKIVKRYSSYFLDIKYE